MVISHNLMAMNAQRQFNIVTDKKAKTTERLSSGYRINRAADDAAGLAISEKMRHLIRSLNQGTNNAYDGVSWVQIGDGALNEVSDMIHRMNELAIKSLNGTNSDSDREALNAEFLQLKTEVDRVSQTTKFNTLSIFEEHEPNYAQLVGARVWEPDKKVTIEAGFNTLSFDYKSDPESDVFSTATIEVEAGEYTIEELADEIDSALDAKGYKKSGIDLQFTKDGTFNLNYENGAGISTVNGGLSFIFNEQYRGGSLGTLLGTTVFPTDDSKLLIASENNTIEFTIDDLNGNEITKKITIADGNYTRQELIDKLNVALSDTSVSAIPSGRSIKLASDDHIITGFKGNMFKIDAGARPYTSVFYDNVQYGAVDLIPASIKGAAVLSTDLKNLDHSKFVITSSNNKLSFSANGALTSTVITIPDGAYSASEMADKLNSLFAGSSLGLKAESFLNGDYYGISITSTIEGHTSSIGIDKSSSAYGTLFTDRTTNVFTNTAVNSGKITGNSTYRSVPYTYGRKNFGSSEKITIEADKNDSFDIIVKKVSDTTDTSYRYTIKLNPGEYNSTGLVDEINNQIGSSSNLADIKGKLEAFKYSNAIGFKGLEAGDLYSITITYTDASKTIDTANQGFKDIFCIAHTTSTSVSSGTRDNPSITLNSAIPDKYTFTSADNTLYVYEDGTDTANLRKVVFENREYTRDEMLVHINDTLKATSTDPLFSASSGYVSQSSPTNETSVSGTTTYNTVNASVSGVTEYAQGSVGTIVKDEVAKVVVGESLNKTTTINSSNDILNITINGRNSGNIQLTRKNYTKDELVAEIQNKLDAVFGKSFGGVKVSLNGNGNLVFEAVKDGHTGSETSISYQTSNSTFFKYAEATKTKPVIESTYSLNATINLLSDSEYRTLSFNVKEGGITRTKTVTLDPGTYSKDSFISALNSKLSAYDIKAYEKNGKLVYEYENGGDNAYLSISYTNNYRLFAAMYGAGYTGYAKLMVPSSYPMNDVINITDGKDEFKVTAGGKTYSVTLTKGTYSNLKDFTDMLTNAFKNANVPLTASYSAKSLILTSTIPGSKESILLSYASGGSSMDAIFAKMQQADISATLSADKKLILSKTGRGSLYVTPSYGSIFQKNVTDGVDAPYSYSATKTFAKIDGGNISFPLTINEYNSDLSFDYLTSSRELYSYPYSDSYYNHQNVSISLTKKTYSTADELKTELQSKIDSALGTNKLKVSVDNNGVVITATTPGNSFGMEKFSGGFYDRVINTVTPKTAVMAVSETAGGQRVSAGFAVGRKDINHNVTDIKTGVNDVLKIDFTDPSKTKKTVTVTLDAGQYTGGSLASMINSKLSEELIALGLDSDLITAQVGGVHTGVVGSDDANALVFKLCDRHEYVAEGEYIIDGVSGSAAFSVFYKTEGEISVAYNKGTKNLTEDIEIGESDKNLSFTCGGTKYDVEIDEGTYSPEDIVTLINGKLKALGANALAGLEDEKLRIYATKYGNFEISDISGGLADKIFYNVEKGDGLNKDVRIQLSDNIDNYLNIEKKLMNTAKLGLNTLVISKEKYAGKAVDRLSEALANLSSIRSYFGAMQNRLEHSIENLKNVSENTQAAESQIRDADMAKEMVSMSLLSILEQAGITIMTQANQSNNIVLALLQ